MSRYRPSVEPPVRRAVSARVKWFDPEKGFGFVGLSDGTEAFLPMSAVRAAGLTTLGKAAPVEVDVTNRGRGPFVILLVPLSE